MNISMILEMAASAGDRPAVTAEGRSLTASGLLRLAQAAADRFRRHPAVLYLGANHLAYPVALFGAALAGVPFVPLNYRLGEHQLTGLRDRHLGALVLEGADLDALLVRGDDPPGPPARGGILPPHPPAPLGDRVAVLLYTSGTTAEPKAAVLRHRHLTAYVLNTVEFGSAGEGDATLVSVPPYHVAGLANLLTNLYAGRRVVYMGAFGAGEWLQTVRRERITHAMLVPTMLARIVAEVNGDDAGTPTLRSLAYGGARMPRPVLERALQIFPAAGFVNAYGLMETASSVAVLGPDDHRKALASDDPAVRDRLGSVGQALPGIEFQIRADDGEPAGRARPGWCSCGESRSPGSMAARVRWIRPAGLPPGTVDGSMPRATCSSRGAPTTPSSGVARTSPPPRSRTSSSPAPGSPKRPWSGCPIPSGGSGWSPSSSATGIRPRSGSESKTGSAPPRRPTPSCSAPNCPRPTPENCCAAPCWPSWRPPMPEAVLTSALRTPIGTAFKGTLRDTTAFDLAHHVVAATAEGLQKDLIDDVILGEGLAGGGVVARHAAITAGLPLVPRLAHNRHCAAGLAAVQGAAASVRAGMDELIIAGGVNSASTAPRSRLRVDGEWVDWFPPTHPDRPDAPNMDMSITVGWNAAVAAGVTRAEMDAWALRSHRNAVRAIDEARFDAEIVPIKTGHGLFSVDEHPRRDTSLEKLASLKPLHPEIEGFSITAGNACGANDGAAALVVASNRLSDRLGLPALATVLSWASVGVDPAETGLAPVRAIPKALARAGAVSV